MGRCITPSVCGGGYLPVPLALWLFGPLWMLAGSLVLVTVLYRLDREA
jgi:hypothetical protein